MHSLQDRKKRSTVCVGGGETPVSGGIHTWELGYQQDKRSSWWTIEDFLVS